MNRIEGFFSVMLAPLGMRRAAVAGHGSTPPFERYPRIADTSPEAQSGARPKQNWLASLAGGLFGWSKQAIATLPPMPLDERTAVARLVCGFIRGGYYEDAQELLKLSLERSPDQATFLNLAGAVCEACGDWRMARRYYGRAIAADRRNADAQQNMRRIFELFTYGVSREPIALGDEEADGRTPVLHQFPEHAEGKPAGFIRPAGSGDARAAAMS